MLGKNFETSSRFPLVVDYRSNTGISYWYFTKIFEGSVYHKFFCIHKTFRGASQIMKVLGFVSVQHVNLDIRKFLDKFKSPKFTYVFQILRRILLKGNIYISALFKGNMNIRKRWAFLKNSNSFKNCSIIRHIMCASKWPVVSFIKMNEGKSNDYSNCIPD